MNVSDALQLLELAAPITRANLKKAYRDALMVWHPDRFTGNTDLQQKAATKTYLINEAYTLLSKIPDSGYPYRKSSDAKTESAKGTDTAGSDPKKSHAQDQESRGGSSSEERQSRSQKTDKRQENSRAKRSPRSLLDRVALTIAGAASIVLAALIIHVWPKKPAEFTADDRSDNETLEASASASSNTQNLSLKDHASKGSGAYQKALELLKAKPSNNVNAFELFVEAAKHEHAEAQYQLGLAFTSGKGILGFSPPEADTSELLKSRGKKYFRMAAENGHPDAQYLIGQDYYWGWDAPEDKAMGVSWYEKAAAQGHVEAQAALGDHFHSLKATEADKALAFSWYIKAANAGHSKAQEKVGDAYRTGLGTARDYREAAKWYSLAANQNSYESKIWLGVAFEKGDGVTADLVESHKWYALAKAQRDKETAAETEAAKQFRVLKKIYITQRWDCLGLEGIESRLTRDELQESARRQRLFLSSAPQITKVDTLWRLSSADGKATLDSLKKDVPISKSESIEDLVDKGDAYYFGRDVTPNQQEAFRWWLKAAELGDSGAQYNVGRCYATGEGVPKNLDDAIHWYALAAAQGHSDAQYNLASCYATGNGLAKDLVKAAQLCLSSAEQGNVRAQFNLGNCYNDGIGVERDEREAAKWYLLAAEQGHPDAQFYLGLAYGGGVGVAEDDVEAYKWYLLAAEQNQKSAKKLLSEYQTLPEQESAARQRVAEHKQKMASKGGKPKAMGGIALQKKETPALTHLPSDSRPSTGTVLTDKLAKMNGLGKLIVVNGLNEDAFVKIIQHNALVVSFYVRGGANFTFDHIPDGEYSVMFCTGFGWDRIKSDFERGRHARRYDSPLIFETTTTREGNSIVTSTDVLTLTLHAVADGNARTSDVPLDEFDRY